MINIGSISAVISDELEKNLRFRTIQRFGARKRVKFLSNFVCACAFIHTSYKYKQQLEIEQINEKH
jgi:hypothetical protein